MTALRAAIYARVSSIGQREHKTIESQLRILPAYVERQGWQLVGTYVDDGLTAKAGTLDARTGFSALLADMALGKFDVVVVIDLDRLTRSEDIAERFAVLGAFQRARVRIACAGSGTIHDLNTTEGDLGVTMGSWFAAEWSRKHRIRVVEGKLTAIARGKKPAGPTPYGYRYDRATGVWSIDAAEGEVVREIFARALAGETGETIAADLRRRGVPRPWHGQWSRERVYGVLKQPAYRGEWIADKRRKLTIATPALVDADTWFAVRDRAGSIARRGRRRREGRVYLLEGIAVCGLCGAALGIASPSFRGRTCITPARYVCGNRRRPPIDGERCQLPYFLSVALDARVWGAIAKLILQPGRLERVAKTKRDAAEQDDEAWLADVKAAKRRLAEIERMQLALFERCRLDMISEDAMDRALLELKPKWKSAEAQVEAAERARFAAGRAIRRANDLGLLIENMRQRAAEASPEKRRELVQQIIPRGGVTVSIAEVLLDLNIRNPARSAAGPLGIAGYSSHDETSIRFRVVA